MSTSSTSRPGSQSGATRSAESPWRKRLLLPHLQNTVYLTYRLIEGDGAGAPLGPERLVQLILRPLMHFRSHDAPVSSPHAAPYRFTAWADRYEISSGGDIPPLRVTMVGRDPAFTLDIAQTTQVSYPLEAQRGYESTGDLWSPGFFRVALTLDEPTTLIASVESWETLLALTPEEAHRAERGRLVSAARHVSRGDHGPDASRGETAHIEAELVLAVDQFLIIPDGRVADAAWAHAAGEEVRTVIAGYHSVRGSALAGLSHPLTLFAKGFHLRLRDGLPGFFRCPDVQERQ